MLLLILVVASASFKLGATAVDSSGRAFHSHRYHLAILALRLLLQLLANSPLEQSLRLESIMVTLSIVIDLCFVVFLSRLVLVAVLTWLLIS